MNTENKIQEILDRTRRTETRLTKYLIAQGFETPTEMPEFREGIVSIPSPHTSLKQIIDTIPETWREPVKVYIGSQHFATIDERLLPKRE